MTSWWYLTGSVSIGLAAFVVALVFFYLDLLDELRSPMEKAVGGVLGLAGCLAFAGCAAATWPVWLVLGVFVLAIRSILATRRPVA